GDGERIELVADHELERLVLQARRARVSVILVVNAGLNAMKAGRHIFDDVVVQVAQLAKFREPKDGQRVSAGENRPDQIVVVEIPLATKRQRTEVAGDTKPRVSRKEVIGVISREPGQVDPGFDVKNEFRVESKRVESKCVERLLSLQPDFRHRKRAALSSEHRAGRSRVAAVRDRGEIGLTDVKDTKSRQFQSRRQHNRERLCRLVTGEHLPIGNRRLLLCLRMSSEQQQYRSYRAFSEQRHLAPPRLSRSSATAVVVHTLPNAQRRTTWP